MNPQNKSEAPLILRKLFDKAVLVADPMQTIPRFLPQKPTGKIIVIGAGKASARMAESVETQWGACEGIIITRYGYGRPTKAIEIVEAAHPVPDENGVNATNRILDIVKCLDEDDFVLCLISGGASALLCSPIDSITLAEKQNINRRLLACGASIDKINLVRKHFSNVKGGQLAAAVYPAKMLSLILSDVAGNEIQFIGSGPTVGDNSTFEQALKILSDYNIETPKKVINNASAQSGVILPTDMRLSKTENIIFAAPSQSLEAASKIAIDEYGFEVINLGDELQGEAREVARKQAEQAMQIQQKLTAAQPPVLLLSGGELTVTAKGNGIGGPNAEFCLALAIALKEKEGIFGFAADTDGVDGKAEVAGAFITPTTLKNAEKLNVSPVKSLENNDSHRFFGKINSQVITGPTLTNVNDFRAILIYPS